MENDAAMVASMVACVGLDWGDTRHAVQVQVVDGGAIESLDLEQKPDVLHAWVAQLRQRFHGRPIGIAVEQRKGAVMYALMAYDFLVLYPVNPKALARYREAFRTSGAKDDPTDAALLLDLLQKHRDQLRAWRPDTVGIFEDVSIAPLIAENWKLETNQRAFFRVWRAAGLALRGVDFAFAERENCRTCASLGRADRSSRMPLRPFLIAASRSRALRPRNSCMGSASVSSSTSGASSSMRRRTPASVSPSENTSCLMRNTRSTSARR